MKLDAVKQTFIVESQELLSDMEQSLLQLEKEPDDSDAINAVFRAAHTIKGSGGMFGYTHIVEFTHVVENFLENLRQGKYQVQSDMIAVLLDSCDHMSKLVEVSTQEGNEKIGPDIKERSREILERLGKFSGESGGSSGEKESAEEEAPKGLLGVVCDNPNWHISIRCHESLLKHGLDPISFINYLSGTGDIKNVVTLSDKIPSFDTFDPEKSYLGFEISLDSSASRDEVEGVFEFMFDDADIVIIEPYADLSGYKKLFDQIDNPTRLEQILDDMGALKTDEIQIAMGKKAVSGISPPGESSSVETKSGVFVKADEADLIPPQEPAAAPGFTRTKTPEEKSARSLGETAAKFIRIEAKKLDNLINLVGELVINGANIRQLAENNGDKELVESSMTMNRLVEEVRDSAMNIRMVQIGETFRKFERVVRDLSHKMGKEIELHISGGDTELDKTVVEKINDPLMHLIRNSIDHGISTPAERVAQGKESRGEIGVNAYHDTGNIVIEISDDGEGLSRDKIYKKALEKGIAKPGIDYSDAEIYNFIFEPGLSTASQVTDISGRGVGMDVVRRNIESLRGTIEVDSEPGEGTVMKISLPLTLAIIDGFLVEIGDVSYVIPLDMVLECINLNESDEISKESGNFVNLRGEVLPYLRMREFFSVNEDTFDQDELHVSDNIIVVKYGIHKAGLMVDRLMGEFQTVIKPLGKIFKNMLGISGATILGSGDVALILDIPKLIKHAQEIETTRRVEETH